MKRFIIMVLVLGVVGVAFYWGYKNAIKPKQQIQITKTPPPGSIIVAQPSSIPANAISRETTMVVNLGTPTIIFDDAGNNSRLEITINPRTPTSNSGNQKQYVLDIMLNTPPPSIRMISSKIATAENKPFTFSIGGNPTEKATNSSSVSLDGTINSLSDNQVQATMKLSTW
ncbi:MAG: hypothetical protein ACE14V_11770 [bacterium]